MPHMPTSQGCFKHANPQLLLEFSSRTCIQYRIIPPKPHISTSRDFSNILTPNCLNYKVQTSFFMTWLIIDKSVVNHHGQFHGYQNMKFSKDMSFFVIEISSCEVSESSLQSLKIDTSTPENVQSTVHICQFHCLHYLSFCSRLQGTKKR